MNTVLVFLVSVLVLPTLAVPDECLPFPVTRSFHALAYQNLTAGSYNELGYNITRDGLAQYGFNVDTLINQSMTFAKIRFGYDFFNVPVIGDGNQFLYKALPNGNAQMVLLNFNRNESLQYRVAFAEGDIKGSNSKDCAYFKVIEAIFLINPGHQWGGTYGQELAAIYGAPQNVTQPHAFSFGNDFYNFKNNLKKFRHCNVYPHHYLPGYPLVIRISERGVYIDFETNSRKNWGIGEYFIDGYNRPALAFGSELQDVRYKNYVMFPTLMPQPGVKDVTCV